MSVFVALWILLQSVPVLNSVTPNAVQAGSASVQITLIGSGFTSSSIVRVDGESLPTTFISSTTLRCLVPDNKLTRPAALSVTIFNQDSSQGSQPVVFSVYSTSPPTVSSINPVAGFRGSTLTVTVTGTNLIGANLSFSGSGITAMSQAGTATTFPVQVSIASDAPSGSQLVTVSTPSGSTARCGQRACTFSVIEPGSWTVTSTPSLSRFAPSLVQLADGRILIAGGSETASAEIFDPATGQWTRTGAMNVARRGAGFVLLPDGRVLVTGGVNNDVQLSSAEIYDPATGLWTTTGFMSAPGGGIMLTNGKVWCFTVPGALLQPKFSIR